jgi:putative transposase
MQAYANSHSGTRQFDNRLQPSSEKMAEIVEKLRQGDCLLAQGKKVSEAVEIMGVSASTYRRWRLQFGRFALGDEKLLRVLEAENAHLRKTVTDLALQTITLREALERG